MSAIRTVTLEILRHGPPHNHLLSPLTQYMALSDGFEPTSLTVPYEHRRFLRDLNVLRYAETHDSAAIELIAGEMSKIFAAVPGLISGLGRRDGKEQITHLRLIFSAAELSLLPFELANAPPGFPGEGKSLSLQFGGRIVMTREVRAAPGRHVRFPDTPKILFVYASPPGYEPVPDRAHLLALGRALAFWAGPSAEKLDQYLDVLPNATRKDVENACRRKAYTHVHFLAHGASFSQNGEPAFGLALHDSQHGSDVVCAERLLAAIRGHRGDAAGFSCPVVVSLASCDSANRARVMVPGGSLAHELHEAGIPLVVGSQFPLTMRGSVVMTDALYGGLLRGDDPRQVLHDVRQRLSGNDQTTHDWASLLAYASFGTGLDEDVLRARYFSARQAMWGASSEIDGLLKKTVEDHGRIAELRAFADSASMRLPRGGRFELDALGNIGAKLKRNAHHDFLAARPDGQQRSFDLRRSVSVLGEARDAYRAGARLPFEGRGIDSTLDWLIAQWLTLDFVLGEEIEKPAFFMAYYLAKVDAAKLEGDSKAWAYGSLLDLDLIRFGLQDKDLGSLDEAGVEKHLREALDAIAPRSFTRSSMVRQLSRWADWWGDPDFCAALRKKPERVQRVAKLARDLISKFPQYST